ncbi:MAG: RNA polymerase sigma factor [Kangiellaceae bacterium]|nr:RNA polymerase sigma factor [Kangiellaceae bacterium]
MKLLVLQTKAMLFAMLLRLLEHHDAEEVMQEAYFRVYIERKKGVISEERPLLFRIAKNLAISRIRRRKVEDNKKAEIQSWNSDLLSRPSSERIAIEKEQKRNLLEAVNMLPPVCRQVFIMRKIEELSHQDIARTLGVSTKTVENHLTRGMHLCRKYLLRNTLSKSEFLGKRNMSQACDSREKKV